MTRFMTAGIVILFLLPLFCLSGAMAFTVDQQKDRNVAAFQGKTGSEVKVVNIVVDKIEDGAIYSADGTKYEITGQTRVFNNRQSSSKLRTAELFFHKGNLVAVSIK